MARDLYRYRSSQLERSREADLLSLLPTRGKNALDIGTRDGHYAKLLTQRFDEVIALDRVLPDLAIPRVVNVCGDVTALGFPDNSFELVFCAEVLEHVPKLAEACREIARVTNRWAVIGVPFEQDLRIGETQCVNCGRINPPWGHVNSFNLARLKQLFCSLHPVKVSLIGSKQEGTSALAVWLMRAGGSPWGMYYQEEPCIHCGARLVPPAERSLLARCCSKMGSLLDRFHQTVARSAPIWIHLLFEKPAKG